MGAWLEANNQRVTIQFVNRRQICLRCGARLLGLLVLLPPAVASGGKLPAAASPAAAAAAATLGQAMHTCLAREIYAGPTWSLFSPARYQLSPHLAAWLNCRARAGRGVATAFH